MIRHSGVALDHALAGGYPFDCAHDSLHRLLVGAIGPHDRCAGAAPILGIGFEPPADLRGILIQSPRFFYRWQDPDAAVEWPAAELVWSFLEDRCRPAHHCGIRQGTPDHERVAADL